MPLQIKLISVDVKDNNDQAQLQGRVNDWLRDHHDEIANQSVQVSGIQLLRRCGPQHGLTKYSPEDPGGLTADGVKMIATISYEADEPV